MNSQLEKCHGAFCELRHNCVRHTSSTISFEYTSYLRNIPYRKDSKSCPLFVPEKKSSLTDYKSDGIRSYDYKRRQPVYNSSRPAYKTAEDDLWGIEWKKGYLYLL